MDNTEAIKWLELLKQKNIEFDDYSEDTKEIREEATRRYQKSLSLGIQALENQQSIVEELKKIICELRNCYPSMPIFNKRKWREENKAYLDCESIIFKHISELKGE